MRLDQSVPFLLNGPPFPVAETCPQCGGEPDRTLRAHPWIWVGLWKDRACTRCLLGFRPHRPLWAKVGYLASLSALIMLLAVPLVVALVPNWHPAWINTVWLPAAFVVANILGLLVQMRH